MIVRLWFSLFCLIWRYCFSSSSLHCDDVVRNTVVWAHDIEWVNVESLWIESRINITLFVLLILILSLNSLTINIVFYALEIKSINIRNPQSHIFPSNIKVQGSITRKMSKETWNGHAGCGLESEREKRKKKLYSRKRGVMSNNMLLQQLLLLQLDIFVAA